MKHPTSRMLFAHWDAKRGERIAPESADMRPGDLRHLLPGAFTIAGPAPGETMRFRIAGTRICALFGRSLKGSLFADLWREPERSDLAELVRLAGQEASGLVAGLEGWNLNGSGLALELLLLPLRHGGRTGARMIGSLSPTAWPPWAGLVPLDRMELRAWRYIQPRRPEEPDPAFGSSSAWASLNGRRSLLVVHEGGRA